IVPQTPSYMAWLGGVDGQDEHTDNNLVDSIYQDVTVPAGTTKVVLTGYYDVATEESGSTVYDRGSLSIMQNGTVLETVLSLTNATPTADWTAINYTLTHDVAGQTIRVFMTSSNDVTNPTSFYFDSFVLTATYCP
ncbi:MAG TPA: hypothetical protein VGL61_26530, partial [Kofleriaceae bacterium]